MKNEHTHDWKPAWDLGFARYRCACGATGYRYKGSEITAHKFRVEPERDWTEREPQTGYVSAAPSLDYYDRRRRSA